MRVAGGTPGDRPFPGLSRNCTARWLMVHRVEVDDLSSSMRRMAYLGVGHRMVRTGLLDDPYESIGYLGAGNRIGWTGLSDHPCQGIVHVGAENPIGVSKVSYCLVRTITQGLPQGLQSFPGPDSNRPVWAIGMFCPQIGLRAVHVWPFSPFTSTRKARVIVSGAPSGSDSPARSPRSGLGRPPDDSTRILPHAV
jgi:hypothetical protein